MEDCLLIKEFGRNDGLNDVLHQILVDLLVSNIIIMLCGNDHGMDTNGNHVAMFLLVLNCNLGFAIRTNPLKSSILTNIGESLAKLSSEQVGKRHQLRSFVACITKHNSLISSTNILESLILMHSLGNIRALVFDCNYNVALIAVKTFGVGILTDFRDCITHHLLPLNFGSGCDLSEDHHHLPLRRGFAGYFRIGVLGQAGVKDGIGDLVAQLVYNNYVPSS